ncbi:acetate kinase [Paramesorhizobium deserti]|uniref:Acetate kinase n=1 Tax=Paramesorhizobium deserti TaxID=1494590 RepID=A0A135HR25_9HYPH|nr:acetate/propionate family kinase [Paramesorhizobium deserti]KXF75655.1 acetate kinase [Paramesorhizobium deserti]
MSDAILVLNAGSSSLKFAVFGSQPDLPLMMKGGISSLHDAPVLKVKTADKGEAEEIPLEPGALGIKAAVEQIVAEITAHGLHPGIGTVGHRIVHGGRDFTAATILDAPVLAALRNLIPLASIHQPANLDIVAAAAKLFPDTLQVGCFDTAFHAGRPQLAKLYGLPRELTEDCIISFGFHGISYGYIASKLRERYGPEAGGRVIVAHLGSGASLCAMDQGRSIATTMGFSPLDGLVMSTRCGTLDPGAVLYLLQERKLSVEALSRLLYQQSGLLGVSGISGNMRSLLDADDEHAAQAVDLFVYRAGREIGSLAAAVGGLDTLVFTAGIGENSPEIRKRICQAAGWLGVAIDKERNRRNEECVSASGSSVDVLVIPTDEERAVAKETLSLITAHRL